MIGRIKWVYELYVAHHLEVLSRPTKIKGKPNGIKGVVERIAIKDGRLQVKGWCRCDEIAFEHGKTSMSRKPWIERQDVAAYTRGSPFVGFSASFPAEHAPLKMVFSAAGETKTLEIPTPGPRKMATTRMRVFGWFLRDALRGSPGILKAMLFNRPQLHKQVKIALRLNTAMSLSVITSEVLKSAPRVEKPQKWQKVTVVLPVYNALDVLKECLHRVVTHAEMPVRLIAVEDCSSDPQVKPWLKSWIESHGASTKVDIQLIENAENMGFVHTANRGFEAAKAYDDPVLLLNSDALLPKDWASRLLAPMEADDDVATVTPMSNDAEIFNAPVICVRTPLEIGQCDMIDDRARMLCPREVPVDTPTGVGFCMAINPRFLNALDGFDTIFSPGYGEEVDWCNRAIAMGGRNVAAGNIFVEHRGGESFGSAKKQALIARNGAKITERYPDFDMSVQDFIRRDPLATERLALALAYFDTRSDIEDVPVYIAHILGGGAESYLESRIEGDHRKAAIVLRFGGQMRCAIEVHSAFGITAAATDDLDDVKRLITAVSKRRIIYSCAVGDTDPVEIPGLLVDLAGNCPLDILMHDFFPVSPSYTLLDSDFIFRGTPGPDTTDAAHNFKRFDGSTCFLAEWQKAWSHAMNAAANVVVFSEDSKTHVASAYPSTADKIRVKPHSLLSEVPRVTPGKGDVPVIAVLGNIGQHKGIRVLQALSRKLARSGAAKLVVIGRIDPNFPLHRKAQVHGKYDLSDIPALVQKYGISAWLIPSIWPETFSYSTHEAIATGLPVMAFDIGAHGAAVRAAENGHILSGSPEDYLSDDMLNRIIEVARAQAS